MSGTSGRWDEMFQKINQEVQNEEQQVQTKQELDQVEDTQVPEQFLEAAPEFDDDATQSRAEQWAEEDAALKGLSILNVYKQLTGNEVKQSGGKNEKLVFCPAKDHDNRNSEAACLNTSNNTWVCYGQCDTGGGVVDMVAAAAGLPFGKGLKKADFAQAKQKTLEDFCDWTFEKEGKYTVGKSPSAKKKEIEEFEKAYGKLPEEESEPEPQPKKPSLNVQVLPEDNDLPTLGPTRVKPKNQKPVEVIGTPKPKAEPAQPKSESVQPAADRPALKSVAPPKDDDDSELEAEEQLPEIEGIFSHVPEGTPLYEFMKAVDEMSVPKEFSLFRGLQLLSLSAGAFTRGRVGRSFKTTLSVLFVGASGSGKSQSRHAMNEVLNHIVYKWNPSPAQGNKAGTHTGVKGLIEPGSGEFLLQELSQELDEGKPYRVTDVMGDLEVDELSRFMGKGAVVGSSLVGVFQEMDNDSSLNGAIKAGSRSGGTVVAVNPNLVFSAGVQPKALPQLIGKGNIGNGLLARFEVITGNKLVSDNIFDNKMKDMSYCQELYTDVAVYYGNKVDPEGKGIRRLFHIEVDHAARPLMQQAYEQIEQWKSDEDIKSRFDLKLFKFATLFAINRKSDFVMKEDVESAMWLMEYINRSTTLSGEKTTIARGGEIEQLAIKAAIYWTKKNGYVTTGQMMGRINPDKHSWDPAEVRKRIEGLAEAGELLVDPRTAARGPKSVRYVYPGALSKADLKIVEQADSKKRKSK